MTHFVRLPRLTNDECQTVANALALAITSVRPDADVDIRPQLRFEHELLAELNSLRTAFAEAAMQPAVGP